MSLDAVDLALSAPIPERAATILALTEDQWFDRKSGRIAPSKLAEAICAFANAEGGTIVVGLHDGRVDGIRERTTSVNAWRQASIDFVSPPARVRVEEVPCLRGDGVDDALLVLRVLPGEVVHEMSNGDCYLRVGDESRKLTFAQRQELSYDRGGAQYDGTPVPGLTIADLDEDLLEDYRRQTGFAGPIDRLLRNRGLLDEAGVVTVAGLLLFAPDATSRLPQAQVRVVRYRATDRGVGASFNAEAGHDARVEGAIPRVIAEVRRLVSDWQPRRTALGSEGRFEDLPLVPDDVWLEAVVNAVVHRSYSLSGDHIRVEVFPDRIEVESPGRFPGLADPSAPLGISRYARNPRIARVCTDLGITREFGEGIRRMFHEMRGRGLADPVYSQTRGTVRLTLSSRPRIPQEVLDRLPRGATDTLNTLREARRALGTGDLLSVVDASRPTLLRHLAALREAGLVEWRGRSPKDPRAVWSVSG